MNRCPNTAQPQRAKKKNRTFWAKIVGNSKNFTNFALANKPNAQVAELVDAHVSGACAARREGSSPFLGTNSKPSSLAIKLLGFLFVSKSSSSQAQCNIFLPYSYCTSQGFVYLCNSVRWPSVQSHAWDKETTKLQPIFIEKHETAWWSPLVWHWPALQSKL